MLSTIIKRTLPLLAVLSLGALLAACGAGSKSRSSTATAEAPPPGTVIAEVNGRPVTAGVLNAYINDMRIRGLGRDITSDQRRQIAHQLVQIILAAQDAHKQKLTDKPEVRADLSLQRDLLLANQAVENYIGTHQPSDKVLRQKYQETEKSQSGEEYKARHILVKSKAEAEKIITQLNKGANFADLAKKDSTGPSAKEGGELGWFKPQQMTPPFSAAVEKLKPGEYTKTPVKTQFGWHVILLEKKRTVAPPTFTEMKPLLARGMQRSMIQDYLKQLESQASVHWKVASLATVGTPASTPAAAKPASGAKSAKTTAAPSAKTH